MRTALIISCRSLTDDQRDVDAVVERQTGEKSAEGEGPEGIRARGSDWGQEPDAVAEHQGGDPASVIGDPSEEQAADDGATEEDRLCRRYEVLLVTYPI